MPNSLKSFIKKQKKMFFKILFILGIVSLIILVFRSRTESLYIIDPTNTNTMMSIPLEEAQLTIGDTFIKNDIEVQITKLFIRDYMLIQGDIIRPDKGNVYIIVTYSYKNNSSKIIKPSAQPIIKLQDASGTIYKSDDDGISHYFAEMESIPIILSNLDPSLSISNALVFKVPEVSAHIEGWQVLVEGFGSPVIIDIS